MRNIHCSLTLFGYLPDKACSLNLGILRKELETPRRVFKAQQKKLDNLIVGKGGKRVVEGTGVD